MAIITRTTVKKLLQISSTKYDDAIDLLIPIVQSFVVRYCNNHFLITSVYISAETIAFVDGDPATITDSGDGFVTAGFKDAMDVYVEDTNNNNGIYAIETALAGILTLATGEELIDEDAGTVFSITLVKFPRGIWLPVTRMISFDLQKNISGGIASERLGDHAVTYQQMSQAERSYPPFILNPLNQWRRFKTVEGNE